MGLIGHSFTIKDHVVAIFEGLLSKYDNFITAINSRIGSCLVDEIELLLLAQETHIENHSKSLNFAQPSANVEMIG